MGRKKSKAKEGEAIPPGRAIEPVTQPLEPMQPPVSDIFSRALNGILRNIPTSGLSSEMHYEDLDPKTKKTVDIFVEQLEPEIEAKAKDLMRAEIRDRIVKIGNIHEIEQLVKRGKKPVLMRKRGCIFIQFGSGAAYDEIEEFMVASS
jgi:hypothetical protein